MSEKTDHNEQTDPLIGTIIKGGFISETPPDVDEFLTEIGFTGKLYHCTIKRAPKEGSGSKEFLPINLKGTYPSINEIGERFGPGQYYYCFSWNTRNPDSGKTEKIFKEYKIYLGTEWTDIYDAKQSEVWAKKEKDIIATAQRKKLQDASRGIIHDDTVAAPDPFADFEKVLGRMKSLGVPIFGGAPLPTAPQDNTNMMMFMMKMQQEASTNNQNMMMKMMMLMMTNNKPQSNNDMFKEIFGLLKGAVDMKELLNPEKQSVVDKVFGLAESVLPALMEIAKKPAAQRANDPLVNLVKDSADFKKMKEDPEMLNEAIRKWDAAHGVKETDIILETVGLKRPGAPEPEPEFEDVTEEDPVEVKSEVIDDSGNIEPNENPME